MVGGSATGTYRFKTGFYGLTDMPAEFQKAIDCTLTGLKNTFCFLDDILIASRGTKEEHLKLVEACLNKLENENLAIPLRKCKIAVQNIEWLGYQIVKNIWNNRTVPINEFITTIAVIYAGNQKNV